MIINDDCLNAMRQMKANSIDFVVTDPPYGLHFMGKDWDDRIPSIEIWAEALRVCKPGAMLAAFGGSRTHHHLMLAIEGSGWEIRDCIIYLYGSGFPKSHNHFGLEGFGTALKPAYEPIILAMKPLDGTFKQNVEKWGIGGINVDSSRIETNDNRSRINYIEPGFREGWGAKNTENHPKGRWPANIILDEEAAKMLDDTTEKILHKSGKSTRGKLSESMFSGFKDAELGKRIDYNDEKKGASRFFYCAKASSKERNKGVEKNPHPTVKPISLMKYIITLLAPPNNPTLLDPFAGSGSTLVAAAELGINAIGIEKQAEYCEIARKRIAATDLPLFKFGT